MNIVQPEGLVFWALLIFLILFFLLTKFAWKPILSAVKEREQSINQALDAAKEAKKEVANMKADNERLLAEARQERDNILKEARAVKEQIVAQAKQEAQVEANKIINAAKLSIEAERKQAVTELKAQVAELSADIAQRVVGAELSKAGRQEELIAQMLQEVQLN